MANPAQMYVDHFQVAAAAFGEGFSVLAESAEAHDGERRPAIAYGNQLLTTGYLQLEAAAKLYAKLPECAQRSPVQPIITDPSFRAAATSCANQLESGAAHLSIAGRRISATLRKFIEENDPAQAHVLAASCDAAARLSKGRSGRAA